MKESENILWRPRMQEETIKMAEIIENINDTILELKLDNISLYFQNKNTKTKKFVVTYFDT